MFRIWELKVMLSRVFGSGNNYIDKENMRLNTVEMKGIEVVPLQLQSSKYGFVKLLLEAKKPFENEWQKNPYSYEEIAPWIEQGYNYGVLGGCGDLIAVDADTEELSEVVRDKMPETFTVKTSSGFHYYYICQDVRNKIVLMKGGEHYGEIISSGSQVVGPGSIHPDTGKAYEVFNDVEIAAVSQEEIFNNLAEYISSEIIEEAAFSKLTDEYGEPYYLKDEKLTGLNEAFWAGLHNKENIQLYEPAEKKFYKYDGSTGLYREISANVIKQEISKRMLEESRKQSISGLETKRSNVVLNNIISQLKGISEKRGAFNKNNIRIVHLANGVIEFNASDEGDFVSFSPKFYSRNQSPIRFNENAQCPRFLNELLHPATTSDDATLIQKYAGLCLLGNNLIQRFLILDGAAGRGKSTISLIIQGLVGRVNVTQLRTSHLAERFELYRYLKKTLLIGVDVPGSFLSEKGAYVLKALVGGDILDAEQKGGTGSFLLQGNFCVVITSNSRLQVKLDGDIGAWRRRLLIARFESPPPKKKIPNFADVLIAEEGSGILNWALQGLQMALEDIRVYGDIQLADGQSDVVEALLAESDSLRHFLSDCVVSNENGDLSVSEIEEAYAEYCPQKKWNPKPITVIRRELEGLMLELFGTSKSNSVSRDGKSVKGFRRVRLKQ
jgi:P4 family phage/plasmid primase-like protien